MQVIAHCARTKGLYGVRKPARKATNNQKRGLGINVWSNTDDCVLASLRWAENWLWRQNPASDPGSRLLDMSVATPYMAAQSSRRLRVPAPSVCARHLLIVQLVVAPKFTFQLMVRRCDAASTGACAKSTPRSCLGSARHPSFSSSTTIPQHHPISIRSSSASARG
jgi:hypothetical protein